MERIEAQLRDRIAEAAEMGALKFLVDVRAATGRPAPESTSPADRAEFEATTRGLLEHLRRAFLADLPTPLRARFDDVERAGADETTRLLAGQAFLARHLADYWQRFERYQAEHAEQQLAGASKPGWLKRVFGGS